MGWIFLLLLMLMYGWNVVALGLPTTPLGLIVLGAGFLALVMHGLLVLLQRSLFECVVRPAVPMVPMITLYVLVPWVVSSGRLPEQCYPMREVLVWLVTPWGS